MKHKQYYIIHALIRRSRLLSPGTGEIWIEPVVVEDDDGPILFGEYEEARWYLETDEIQDFVGGYKVMGFEIHEAWLPAQGSF